MTFPHFFSLSKLAPVRSAASKLDFIGNRSEIAMSAPLPRLLGAKRPVLAGFLSALGESAGSYAIRRPFPSRHRGNGQPNCETVGPEFDTV